MKGKVLMPRPKHGKDWRDRLGRPTTVVLFRTPLRWRFAIYFLEPGGILDGALPDETSRDSPESAQEAMHRWIVDTFQHPVTLAWTPADEPDRWTGEITDGLPGPA